MNELTINPERVIERAHWIAAQRVPFVHQGRSLQGIDCIGAAAWILEYGGEIPIYPRDPVGGELETELARVLGRPALEHSRINRMTSAHNLRACDIVSMQYAGPIRHIGILVPHISIPNQLALVHTDSDIGCTAEVILDDVWLRRIMKVWRPKVAAT